MSIAETLAELELSKSDLDYIESLERLLTFTTNNDISRDEIEKRLSFMYKIINQLKK